MRGPPTPFVLGPAAGEITMQQPEDGSGKVRSGMIRAKRNRLIEVCQRLLPTIQSGKRRAPVRIGIGQRGVDAYQPIIAGKRRNEIALLGVDQCQQEKGLDAPRRGAKDIFTLCTRLTKTTGAMRDTRLPNRGN